MCGVSAFHPEPSPQPTGQSLRHSGYFSMVEIFEGMMPPFCWCPGLVSFCSWASVSPYIKWAWLCSLLSSSVRIRSQRGKIPSNLFMIWWKEKRRLEALHLPTSGPAASIHICKLVCGCTWARIHCIIVNVFNNKRMLATICEAYNLQQATLVQAWCWLEWLIWMPKNISPWGCGKCVYVANKKQPG